MKRLAVVTAPVVAAAQQPSPRVSEEAVANALLEARRTNPRPQGLVPMVDVWMPRQLWDSWTEAGHRPRLVRALTAAERDMVTMRRDELEPWLAPYHAAEKDDVVVAVLELLNGYRLRQTEEEAAANADSVARLLRRFPSWAIEDACEDIRLNGYTGRDGKVERHWPPTDTEIVYFVRSQMARMRAAHDQACALLTAEVRDERR